MTDLDLAGWVARIDAETAGAGDLHRIAHAQRLARELTELGHRLVEHYLAAADPTGAAEATEAAEAHSEEVRAAEDQADALLDEARQRAQRLGHRETNSGHLLLALTAVDDAAPTVLAGLGVSPEALESAIAQAWEGHAWWRFPVPPGDFPPLALGTAEVYERITDPSAGAGLLTERLLLSVLQNDTRSPGRPALHTLGLTTRQVYRELTRRLAAA
ncbi:Clp protease N-terminal domain-containing protein [Kitasatospora sp. NPDC059673]|uniref:Clp protease N-terminal domain-containing protein n=1 Tax=Kitasatospora sp. NPDC059673 TaxID=3346901 RepID=UPI0036C9F67A